MLAYLNEFRTSKAAGYYLRAIEKVAPEHQVTLMEICGGHTLTLVKYGLKALLPEQIRLISGPGCPVCVTAQEYIDTALELCKLPDVIITSFGDMLRVPGSYSSLSGEKARGADVRVCLSSLDAVEIARRHTDKQVVFLGIGFETTAPTVAYAVKTAHRENLTNFSVLSALKTIPSAMHALMQSGETDIQGFICPGHVSTITGTSMYEQIVKQYAMPCVVCGFEPTDMLCTIAMIMAQLKQGAARVENQYKRSVKLKGNTKALEIMEEVFEEQDSTWRGLGVIPRSGLKIRDSYKLFDAAKRFSLTLPQAKENPACICGAVMRGIKIPSDCALFAKKCTPDSPVGACMVSGEGICGIYYKYSQH
ncbi:MAG: hydrogenase formation protein HypD [Spirochaetales bacterium]|nr:hydrogenase formation protein HypD [Spirochaetales bacterium]